MVDLTKKNVNVELLSKEPAVQAAICTLKQALITAPVLALPRWDRPWIVKTDASLTGLGAVLAQANDDGDEKPVAYFARQLTPAEKNYSVTEIECLAVIAALKTWRSYLWTYTNKAFLLHVDHAALLYLQTCVDSAGGGSASRLTRWSLKLQEYNFVVKHRAGRIHHDADFLSRMAGSVAYEEFKASAEGAQLPDQGHPLDLRSTKARPSEKGSETISDAITASVIAEVETTGDVSPFEVGKGSDLLDKCKHPTISRRNVCINDLAPCNAYLCMCGYRNFICNCVPDMFQIKVKEESPEFQANKTHKKKPPKPAESPIFTVQDVESFFNLVEIDEDGEARLDSSPQKWLRKYLSGKGEMPIQTAEAIMGRLRDMQKPRLAAEIADLLTDAGIASKKALYFALDAAHQSGLHLLAAPLVRTLGMEFGVPHNQTRTMLKTLRLEFEHPSSPDKLSRGYQRYEKAAKIMWLNEDRSKVWCHYRTEASGDSKEQTLDLPGGTSEKTDANIQETLWRELREELGILPPVAHLRLQELLKKYPSGMSRAKIHPPNPWKKMHVIHVWAIPIEAENGFVFHNEEPAKHIQPGWRPVAEFYADLSQDRLPYALAAEKAGRRVDWATEVPKSLTMGHSMPAIEHSLPAREIKTTLRKVTPVWSGKGLIKKVELVKEAIVALVTASSDNELGAQTIINAATSTVTKLPRIAAKAATAAISLREVWKNYSTADLPGTKEIQLAQQTDEWCSSILRFLIAESIPPGLRRQAVMCFVTVSSGYTLRGGLLFKYPRDPRSATGSLLLAVPQELREVMLQAFHDRAGHLGTVRTYQTMRQRIYWPGMWDEVVEHVNPLP